MTRRAVAVLAVVFVAVATACSGAGHSSSADTTGTTEHTQTFVAIGDDGTLGTGLDEPLQQVWPRLVFTEALPRTTVFVNTAIARDTIGSALLDQVPLAEQLHPSIIAMWLGTPEVAEHEPVDRFRQELRALLSRLARTDARLFVADIPHMGSADPAPYNAALRTIVAQFGATLVPLSPLRISTTTVDGIAVPDVNGNRTIAGAFDAALKSAS